jgi:tRNA (cmo5U34)-methyltransferase
LLDQHVSVRRPWDVPPEAVERIRTAYSCDVALLPPDEVGEVVASGGFDTPIRFLQTGLIHAWFAKRTPTDAEPGAAPDPARMEAFRDV